jgi:molybdopterin converting factor subunit 1
MNQIQLLYYAQLREESGCNEESVETDSATAADLFDELSARYGFTLKRDHIKVAVNDEFKDWSTALSNGDQVVFIPPVAGGTAHEHNPTNTHAHTPTYS